MDKDFFTTRMSELRMKKGVSARDMSLSLGQSAGYINNIENGINYPSMATFFYICEYLGVTPKEFFDTEAHAPVQMKTLVNAANKLDDEQLGHLIALVEGMTR